MMKLRADFSGVQLRNSRNEVSRRTPDLHMHILVANEKHIHTPGPIEFVNFATRWTRSFPLRIMACIAFIVNCTRRHEAQTLSLPENEA